MYFSFSAEFFYKPVFTFYSLPNNIGVLITWNFLRTLCPCFSGQFILDRQNTDCLKLSCIDDIFYYFYFLDDIFKRQIDKDWLPFHKCEEATLYRNGSLERKYILWKILKKCCPNSCSAVYPVKIPML